MLESSYEAQRKAELYQRELGRAVCEPTKKAPGIPLALEGLQQNLNVLHDLIDELDRRLMPVRLLSPQCAEKAIGPIAGGCSIHEQIQALNSMTEAAMRKLNTITSELEI